MEKEQILNWLNEIADNEPINFQEYFYNDIRNYIIEEKGDIRKIQSFFHCQNKHEVEKFLEVVSSYIVMNLDSDLLIENYFN